MSEDWSRFYAELPTDRIAEINEICDRFEQSWRQGVIPAIGDYLTLAPDSIRKLLLYELALIDASYREQASGVVDLNSKYQRFPEFDQSWLAKNCSTSEKPNPITGLDAGPPRSSRYEIIAEIGRGGMGVVYQAKDCRLGRIVCLKSLHPESMRSPQRMARFLREARIVSSLNHPNICTIHELEEDDDQPFLVLEWIDGTTIRELTRQGRDSTHLVDVLTQVAKALEAAHAAGVIHRDVKPENLMVRGDGLVKVLDFGLARLVESEPSAAELADERTAEGAVVGTAKYMSPEQARGEPISAASDIFSLGIVLYELATSRHPFPGNYLAAILSAIAEVDPLPVLAACPECEPRLAKLVDRMLEKRPKDRPTATEVVEILGKLRGLEREPELSLNVSRVGTPDVVVGREYELNELHQSCTAAERSRGSAIFVSGEPGIGKTTLIEAFVDDLTRRKRFIILHGRCSQRLSSSDAYLPVLDALGHCLEGTNGQLLRECLQATAPAWEALTASSSDALARLTAESGQLSPGRLKREFRALLDALTRQRPVLLFIDDLHWCDESTVDLLSYLGQDLHEMRLLILGAYRPTDSALKNQPAELLRRDLIARERGHNVALSFLSREDVAQYLDLHFPAHRFPESLAEQIHSRTEGNPLFISGLVRLMRDGDMITQVHDRWVVSAEPLSPGHDLPCTIANVIDAAIHQLSDEDRKLLQAGSVQGPEFDAVVVADALQLDRAEVEERLRQIEHVHGMIRTVGETDFTDGTLSLRHAFVHILFQEALFDAITPSRRAAWSLETARVLTQLHGRRTKGSALRIALLFEVGRDISQAIDYLLQSARHEVMLGANREAAEVCRRGLRLVERLPASPERNSAELQLQYACGFAETYARGYGSEESLAAYRRAEELCAIEAASKDRFSVLQGLWGYHLVRMDLENRKSLELRMTRLAEDLDLPSYKFAAITFQAMTLLHQGEIAAAHELLQFAQANYQCTLEDDRRFIEQMCMPCAPAFHTALSWLRQLQGREQEAIAETQTAITLEESLGVPQFQVQSWYATLYYFQRKSVQALEWARKSIDFARRTDFEFYLGMAVTIEAWASAVSEEGDDWSRESLVEEALSALPKRQRQGIRVGTPMQMCMLGEALMKLGRHDEALSAFNDSIAIGQETGERWWEAESLRQIGLHCEQAQSDTSGAAGQFRAGLDLAQRQGSHLLTQRCQYDLSRVLGSSS